MKFEPMLDTVIVERELITMDGSVELPQKAWHHKMYGTVVAVGPGMLRTMPVSLAELEAGANPDRYPTQCKVGDIVLCNEGMNMIHADPLNPDPKKTFFFCSERQLVAILRPEE